jgi:hypothetical protein
MALNLTGRDGSALVNGYSNSSVQSHPLGTVGETNDGRIFKYAQAGASDLIAGSLYQSAAPIANHLARTAPVVAVGAVSFTFTPGATAGAANLYAEGYLNVDTGTASENGYIYAVSGHAAITSSVAFTLNLIDPIQVALSASSTVGLVHNSYKNVIVSATTQTAPTAGVAPCIITATQYGWLQTWGPASVLINGTPGVGISVVPSATTAGAVDVATVAAEVNTRSIGWTMQVCVSTKNNLINLRISA